MPIYVYLLGICAERSCVDDEVSFSIFFLPLLNSYIVYTIAFTINYMLSYFAPWLFQVH